MKICVQKIKQKVNDTIDTNDNTVDTIKTNIFIIDTETNYKLNRTLLVGPTFCDKTHLLVNKFQLFRLDNPEQQIKIKTMSPEQYGNAGFALEHRRSSSGRRSRR